MLARHDWTQLDAAGRAAVLRRPAPRDAAGLDAGVAAIIAEVRSRGDAALVRLTRILKHTFRQSDIKGRMGGDEFAIFPIDTSIAGVEAAIGRLKKNIETFNASGDDPFKLSLSTGVAGFDPHQPSTIEDLLIRADKRMYEQKKKNWNV